MSRPRFTVALLGVVLTALVVSGCTRKNAPTTELPAADGLLKAAAADMRTVQTVKFAIAADGTIAGLALRTADGALTRDGDAQGTAQVQQFGTNVEVNFIVKGAKMYIKGPTGGYQEIPTALAASVYDPSAILDPDRGVAKLLDTATGGKTEGRESVDGTDAYRVTAKLDPTTVSTLVPGVSGDLTGQLWIGVERPRLLKVSFVVPPEGNSSGGTVTITLKEFDVPVTVSAP